MTYKTAIIIKQIKWAWKTRQIRWLFPILKMIFSRKHTEKYKVWWDHEICRVYRENHDKLAFKDSFKGLPKLSDTCK